MIRSIDVRNFRCFERLQIDDCRSINVIVGDNGSGKTALLEALFLALGTTTELALRYRQQRGLGGAFSGPSRRVEEAIWRDFFYKRDWSRTISVELTGDGPEARAVRIVRGSPQLSIAIGEEPEEQSERMTAPITFEWRASDGTKHEATPRVSQNGVEFPGSDEDLPDFFFFAANQTLSSIENAGRFSELSQAGRLSDFIQTFTEEYPWIRDLSLEVVAGAPVIYATLDGKERLPLPNVSAGINRMVGIMLGISSRPRSVILVDEVENGIYYKHHVASWEALISFSSRYSSQLFVTTHSEECLRALAKAVKDPKMVALWRLERKPGGPTVRQFGGSTFVTGIEAGGEVR